MLPAVVAKVTAASPTGMSSRAVATVANDKTPEPLVVIACPELPSAVGRV